jgi:hypothetical protein
VSVQYLRDQRHQATVAEIAQTKFPFPSDVEPELETIINTETQTMSAGKHNGENFFPDLVVVRRPGQWLELIAQVETADTVNDESAVNRWLPASQLGELLIYVPAGQVQAAKKLCKKHGVKTKGIRTWRFQPVWGLQVSEA